MIYFEFNVVLCCVEPPGRDQGRDERQGLLGDWAEPQTPSDAWGNRKRGLEHQRTAEKGKVVLLKRQQFHVSIVVQRKPAVLYCSWGKQTVLGGLFVVEVTAKVINTELEFSMFPPVLHKVTVSLCHTRVEAQPHIELLYTGSEGRGHQEDNDQSRGQG